MKPDSRGATRGGFATRVSQRIIYGFIRAYQLTVSPLIHTLGGPGSGCRFYPNCSTYAMEAVREHGPIRGLWLSFRRVLRCNPWGGEGYDPVPPPANWADVLDNRIRK